MNAAACVPFFKILLEYQFFPEMLYRMSEALKITKMRSFKHFFMQWGGGGGGGGGGSTGFNPSVLPDGVCTSSNQCFNLGSATATTVIIHCCVPSWIPLTASRPPNFLGTTPAHFGDRDVSCIGSFVEITSVISVNTACSPTTLRQMLITCMPMIHSTYISGSKIILGMDTVSEVCRSSIGRLYLQY